MGVWEWLALIVGYPLVVAARQLIIKCMWRIDIIFAWWRPDLGESKSGDAAILALIALLHEVFDGGFYE